MAEGAYLIDVINVKIATKILTRRDIRILSQITGNNIYMNKNTMENSKPNVTCAKLETKNLYYFYTDYNNKQEKNIKKKIKKQSKGKKINF